MREKVEFNGDAPQLTYLVSKNTSLNNKNALRSSYLIQIHMNVFVYVRIDVHTSVCMYTVCNM